MVDAVLIFSIENVCESDMVSLCTAKKAITLMINTKEENNKNVSLFGETAQIDSAFPEH